MSLIDLWSTAERGLAPSKGFLAGMGILMSLNDTPGLKTEQDAWKNLLYSTDILGQGELWKTKTEYTDVTLFGIISLFANDLFFVYLCFGNSCNKF